MGLDMFLYLSHYESVECPEKTFFSSGAEELADIIKENVGTLFKTTQYEVAYWRKANAIHKWFVENCADGVDECQEISVSPEQLETLIALCSEVLADHSRAAELLPTEDGFFFGSTEYDEWYFEDLEQTVKMLDPICSFVKANREKHIWWDIIYQASW